MFFFVVKTPEAFGRDKYFRIKSKWNDAEECNNINRFCYGIRDRLKVLFQSTMGMKRSQSMPSQEKQLCPSHIKVFGMIIPFVSFAFYGNPSFQYSQKPWSWNDQWRSTRSWGFQIWLCVSVVVSGTMAKRERQAFGLKALNEPNRTGRFSNVSIQILSLAMMSRKFEKCRWPVQCYILSNG